MANIIEKQKVWRIQHRFDTVENWKKSSVKLRAGELAFDENGNFKVGLSVPSVWNDLPYSGKTKIVIGDEKPSVVTEGMKYVPGDMYKESSSGRWYILTGYTSLGEYIWDELSGDYDVNFVVENLEKKVEELEDSLKGKIDASSLFDETGKVKRELIPDSLDDIVEGVLTVDGNFIPLDSTAQVAVPGKLYVDINTKQVYRWSGSQYISISSGGSLILGTTEGTAYEGSSGKKLEERVDALENLTSDYTNTINSLTTQISNQSRDITQLQTTTEKLVEDTKSISDRVDILEVSDSSQAKRLTSVEGKLIEQIEKTSTLEGLVSAQTSNLERIETKVDSILKVTTPEGELTLGTLAFKDKITDDDIDSISITKIIQEDTDILEIYCGDSTD